MCVCVWKRKVRLIQVFIFLFSFVEEFQFLFNFESSVKLSFSRILGLNFILWLEFQ